LDLFMPFLTTLRPGFVPRRRSGDASDRRAAIVFTPREHRPDAARHLVGQRYLHEKLKLLQAPCFVLNPASPLADADLVIVDEAGMCNQRMGRDLESFGKPILIVGDPYQLKPVYGDGYYDLSNPDVPLTKIYRQHEGPEFSLSPQPFGRGGKSAARSLDQMSVSSKNPD
jgi:hypothetical protein